MQKLGFLLSFVLFFFRVADFAHSHIGGVIEFYSSEIQFISISLFTSYLTKFLVE